MARKLKKQDDIPYNCIDCVHSYDYHEMGARGVPFLCRCPHFKSSRFLYRDKCSKFKLKPNHGKKV